jgi:hypothetical protein
MATNFAVNGLFARCVERAVISGPRAARAQFACPTPIVGEDTQLRSSRIAPCAP